MTQDNQLVNRHESREISEISETGGRDRIKSFALRQGRMTEAQRKALDHLWKKYGIQDDGDDDINAAFPNPAPITLEIGFGNGESLAEYAAAHLDVNFLGIEVHKPGVGHLLLQIESRRLGNVRIFCADAIDVLTRRIPDGFLAGINVFFPDPWPKRRHHKRRLINADFMNLAGLKLKAGGILHLATDWEDYARQMIEVADSRIEFDNAAGPNAFAPRPESRPLTKFERRGQKLGHGVWDLIYRRR